MSVWFNSTCGHELWNPSNRAADFFIAGVRSVEAVLEAESGIGPIVQDEVIVEASMLSNFMVASQIELCHPTMRAQVAGLLAIVAVLLVRTETSVPTTEGWEQLAREVEPMGARMPR